MENVVNPVDTSEYVAIQTPMFGCEEIVRLNNMWRRVNALGCEGTRRNSAETRKPFTDIRSSQIRFMAMRNDTRDCSKLKGNNKVMRDLLGCVATFNNVKIAWNCAMVIGSVVGIHNHKTTNAY